MKKGGGRRRIRTFEGDYFLRRFCQIDTPHSSKYPWRVATKFKLKGKIQVLYYKAGKVFIAYAQALDLSSCGSTFDEADKNLEEAISILFEECDERGTLENVLANCGWESRSERGMRIWSPPAVIGQKEIEIAA